MQRNNSSVTSKRKQERRVVRVEDVDDRIYTPPEMRTPFRQTVLMRYQIQSGTNAVVSWSSLTKLFVMATSTTNAYVTYEAFKLKAIHVYAPAIAQTSATAFVTPVIRAKIFGALVESGTAPLLADRREKTDTPTNEHGAAIHYKFDKSTARWYDCYGVVNLSNTPQIVTLDVYAGCIIDIEIGVQQIFTRTTAPAQLVSTGATAGLVYYNYLDNTSTTGTAGTKLAKCVSGPNTNLSWL